MFGGDLRYSPNRTLDVDAYAMRGESDGPEDDWSAKVGMRLRANRHRGRLSYLYIGEQFRHDLGYVRRRDASMAFGDYSAIFRPKATYQVVRDYELKMEVQFVADSHHRELQTRQLRPSFIMQLADGGQFRATAESSFERLTEPFRLRRTVIIPPGDYSFGEGVLYYESPGQAAVVAAPRQLRQVLEWRSPARRVGVRWRLNAHLAASAEYDRNEITLPEGSFTEGLAAIRLDWSLTTRMFLNAFIQYNGRDDVWLTNVRFNVIHRPLSDIYVVWNDARGPAIRNSGLIVKYTHSLAF